MITLNSILTTAKKEIPPLDAETLASKIFELTRTELITKANIVPESELVEQFLKMIELRKRNTALSKILGVKEFYKLEFDISDDVLTPRPETEWFVEWFLNEYDYLFSSPRAQTVQEVFGQKVSKIIDIGTGSGCIAISLAFENPNTQILAVDICEKALKIAKKNAKKHGVDHRIEFRQSDLLSRISNDEIDGAIIVANLPYIPEDDKTWMDTEVLDGDPELALFSGKKGTDLYQKLFCSIPNTFESLSFEFDPPQKKYFQELLEKLFPERDIRFHSDYAGKVRFGVIK